MKQFPVRLISLVLAAALLVQGCTYHGKIHRGIYKHRDFEEKINARVMVVSDKYYPEYVSSDFKRKYTFRLSDGLPVAVADALGVPAEFKSREALSKNPVTDMQGYGTYPVPAGSWSDDTSMALCALDVMAKEKQILLFTCQGREATV